jgi:ketosteroid isomerase-like protein
VTDAPAEIVRRALLAVNRGDEETFLESLHPDIEWRSHLDGLLPADVWRRREGVQQGRRSSSMGGRHVRTTIHGLVERGDQVLVLGVVTSEMPHRGQASTPIYWVWTVRDGLAVRVESFRSRTAAEAAFSRG